MFESPGFSFWSIAYTAVGAVVLWGTWGRTKLKAFILSDLVRRFLSEPWATVAEFAIFVTLGVLVGIGVVKPINATQAITAGFAWTGAFARPEGPMPSEPTENNDKIALEKHEAPSI